MKDSKIMLWIAGIGLLIAASMMIFKVKEEVQTSPTNSRNPITSAFEAAKGMVTGSKSWFSKKLTSVTEAPKTLTNRMVVLADGSYTLATDKAIGVKDYVGEKYTFFKTGVSQKVGDIANKLGGWFGK